MVRTRQPLDARGRERGITLLETSITLLLASVLASMIGMTLVGTQRLNTDIQMSSRGAMTIDRLLDRIARHIRSGADLVALNDTSLIIQEPVDPDSDGDYVDDDLNVEWGAENTLNYGYEYLWVQTGTFVESTEGVDVNSDGDTSDTYQRGNLVLRVLDSSATPQQTITIAGDGGIFLDSGSIIPPLFSAPTSESIEINLTIPIIVTTQGRTKFQLFQGSRLVTLR